MTRRPWTPAEVALLRAMYPHCHTADVAAWLRRPVGPVYQAAAARGLRKTAAYMAADVALRRAHVGRSPAFVATRFQPGHAPWNKGRAFNPGGRSVLTRFKKGSTPANTQPLGALRVAVNGQRGSAVLERKTSARGRHNGERWTPVTRLVWEAAHGPVPPGHLVVWRNPAQATTVLEQITPDKLECITRAEHARRNHPRNKSPELARLVQLKGAITRQVNRIAREARATTESTA